jgi:radical SAM superfamily enzyme YgiQ (UPF0313 family)
MTGRSPESIARWLELNLYKFDGPGQMLGTEPNAVRRPWDSAQVRWLLAASWDYSQAAGNMAIPALYDAIHKAETPCLADRWYLPATPRDMDLLTRAQVPAFGIESRRQLADFDVVGTSISYSVLFMNLAKHLAMSGVPLRWKDRTARAGDYPMVMAGGLSYAAPEFMAPVVDVIWLGEAEDEPGNPGIAAVCARIAEFKESGDWGPCRLWCYERLAGEFPFLYFPRYMLVDYKYQDRGLPELTKMVSGYRSAVPALGTSFRARRVADLSKADLMTSAPVLFSDPGMGSGDVEVARGCDCWCVFCALSWRNKPYRQEPVSRSVSRAKAWRGNMGSVDIALVAPDPPVHTEKKRLIAELLENVTDRVDASSMRIDDYIGDGDFALLLNVAGTKSVTLGLEAGSPRMRDLAGKGTSDDDVARAVTQAIRTGIRKVKLYMITNWPGEERADVMRVVALGKRLADIRDSFGEAASGVQIIMSWTPLLIEAQTPLQWFAVTPPDYMLADAFRELMSSHRIWVQVGSKASPPKIAFFQACQRASRDAGEAITDVIEAYGTASWGGFPKDMRERLDEALVRHGFRNGLADIFGERFEADLLGWEHIDTGVKRSLMWRAYRDMVDFLEGTSPEAYDENYEGSALGGNEWVPRCGQQCSGAECGACDREDLELRREYVRAVDRDLAAEPVQSVDHSTVALKVRLRVDRPEESRFITNESLEYIIRRAAFRAADEVPGFPAIAARSVRLASGGTGYRERSAGTDYAEFGLTRQAASDDIAEFLAGLALHLGREGEVPWLRWTGEWRVLPAAARLPARPPSLWELEVADTAEALARRLRWWDEAEQVPVLIRAESFYAGATSEHGDAKEHVGDLWVTRDGHRVLLRMILTGRLGPYQAYAALTGKASWIEAARFTARRLEFFGGGSWLCSGCGTPVPSNLLDVPWSGELCPRCADQSAGRVVAGLA